MNIYNSKCLGLETSVRSSGVKTKRINKYTQSNAQRANFAKIRTRLRLSMRPKHWLSSPLMETTHTSSDITHHGRRRIHYI